jgi:hypothetical protein
MKSFTFRSFILPLVVCAMFPVAAMCFLEWAAVAPWGLEGLLWFKFFFTLGGMIVVPALCGSLIGLGFERSRRISAILCLCCLSYIVSFIFVAGRADKIRMKAFGRLAERSAPLVAAIKSYDQKHGKPPESLEALVPEFLAAVPGTGMAAYPKYNYYAGEKAAANYDSNSWVLSVSCPSGIINFDQFLYFPRQNYPATGYGGSLEKVKDWAYVHE